MPDRSSGLNITPEQIERAEYLALLHAEQPQLPVRGGDISWREQAGCSDSDPDLFTTSHAATAAKATRICITSCPTIKQCRILRYASNSAPGVWGGVYYPDRTPAPTTCRKEGCSDERQSHRNPWCVKHEHDIKVGTSAGYGMHQRRKEKACQPCTTAEHARKLKYEDHRPPARSRPTGQAPTPQREDTTCLTN